MNQEEFEKAIYNLLTINQGPHDSPHEDIVATFCWDVRSKSGGEDKWDNTIALDVYEQFKWLTEQS